jgi:hypothetical protein
MNTLLQLIELESVIDCHDDLATEDPAIGQPITNRVDRPKRSPVSGLLFRHPKWA